MYKREIKYLDKEIKSNVEIKTILVSESHWHESIEILYVLEGSVEVIKVDHTYRLNKGDMYIINSHDIHEIKNIGENNIVLQTNIHESYFIKTHGEYYEHMFECRYIKGYEEAYYIESKKPSVDEVKELMLRIFITNNVLANEAKEYPDYTIKSRLIKESNYHLKKLAEILLKEFEVINSKKEKQCLDDVSASRYYQFMRYLCVNYNKKISLEDIAKELNLSKFYVSHLIKERTGRNYRDLLKVFRIENAKRMLLLTDKSISAISEENGFPNAGAFINQFKKGYTITPKEYRDKYKRYSEREVSKALMEEEYLEILNKSLDNFDSFYKNVKRGERLEIYVDLSDNKSYFHKMPKIRHVLVSLNGVSDFRKLDNDSNLFKFNEDRIEFLGKLELGLQNENRSCEEIFSHLIASIEIEKEVKNEVVIKANNINCKCLFDENDIETANYYFNIFINNLKEYVIAYSKDYIVTWDGKDNYYILCIINKLFKEDKNANLLVNFNKCGDKRIKTITKVLDRSTGPYNIIESLKERDIERINRMPKMNIENINDNLLSLKLKDKAVVCIEIAIKDN